MDRSTSARSSRRRMRGLSLIEMMIALAISALLLTATMAAIDASFKAYAAAAEQASTQISTRLIVDRTLTLIRTSTAHGPLQADATATPPVTRNGDIITSNYLELIDSDGQLLRLEYRSVPEELWLVLNPGASNEASQPLMGGVTSCDFFLRRRLDREGVWVLERGTIDMTVQPGVDATIQIERENSPPIRVIASTAPRKLEDQ